MIYELFQVVIRDRTDSCFKIPLIRKKLIIQDLTPKVPIIQDLTPKVPLIRKKLIIQDLTPKVPLALVNFSMGSDVDGYNLIILNNKED